MQPGDFAAQLLGTGPPGAGGGVKPRGRAADAPVAAVHTALLNTVRMCQSLVLLSHADLDDETIKPRGGAAGASVAMLHTAPLGGMRSYACQRPECIYGAISRPWLASFYCRCAGWSWQDPCPCSVDDCQTMLALPQMSSVQHVLMDVLSHVVGCSPWRLQKVEANEELLSSRPFSSRKSVAISAVLFEQLDCCAGGGSARGAAVRQGLRRLAGALCTLVGPRRRRFSIWWRRRGRRLAGAQAGVAQEDARRGGCGVQRRRRRGAVAGTWQPGQRPGQ